MSVLFSHTRRETDRAEFFKGTVDARRPISEQAGVMQVLDSTNAFFIDDVGQLQFRRLNSSGPHGIPTPRSEPRSLEEKPQLEKDGRKSK